jgi:hypothetical protein
MLFFLSLRAAAQDERKLQEAIAAARLRFDSRDEVFPPR